MSTSPDASDAKLVRDRIPEIIRDTGRVPRVSTLDEAAYGRALSEKLAEETEEFLTSGQTEELADILEVVYAIGRLRGTPPEELEALRRSKQAERGGFEQRLFLEGIDS